MLPTLSVTLKQKKKTSYVSRGSVVGRKDSSRLSHGVKETKTWNIQVIIHAQIKAQMLNVVPRGLLRVLCNISMGSR